MISQSVTTKRKMIREHPVYRVSDDFCSTLCEKLTAARLVSVDLESGDDRGRTPRMANRPHSVSHNTSSGLCRKITGTFLVYGNASCYSQRPADKVSGGAAASDNEDEDDDSSDPDFEDEAWRA